MLFIESRRQPSVHNSRTPLIGRWAALVLAPVFAAQQLRDDNVQLAW
jgi:hypothetical protein